MLDMFRFIFFFNVFILNFIIYDFFSLSCNTDLVYLKYYNPAVFFIKRDEILSKLMKF
jgi:hypothetical protein